MPNDPSERQLVRRSLGEGGHLAGAAPIPARHPAEPGAIPRALGPHLLVPADTPVGALPVLVEIARERAAFIDTAAEMDKWAPSSWISDLQEYLIAVDQAIDQDLDQVADAAAWRAGLLALVVWGIAALEATDRQLAARDAADRPCDTEG